MHILQFEWIWAEVTGRGEGVLAEGRDLQVRPRVPLERREHLRLWSSGNSFCQISVSSVKLIKVSPPFSNRGYFPLKKDSPRPGSFSRSSIEDIQINCWMPNRVNMRSDLYSSGRRGNLRRLCGELYSTLDSMRLLFKGKCIGHVLSITGK